MATIKVKLRKSTVAEKPATVYYQVSYRGGRVQIATRMRWRSEAWDAERGRPCADTEEARVLQRRIDADTQRLQRLVGEIDASGRSCGTREFAARFRAEVAAEPESVQAFMRRQIESLQRCRRFGTAKNYDRTLRSFSGFLAGGDLPFGALTEELVDEYEAYLASRGVSRNSSSFYMRILRAVYNKAVRQRLAPLCTPFRNVYTGVARTRKRAIDSGIIARLHRLDLTEDPALALARDLFVFSYCTRGMAFVDIAFLRKADLRDGVIRYVRRKTGQQLYIRIEPGIEAIVARYEKATAGSPYVFPILTTCAADDAYRQYQSALGRHNRLLGRLSQLLRAESRFTSYTPRHSWATAARDCNVPIAVISAGLGHTSERTTQIYLAMLENSVIDRANRAVIGLLER